MPRTTIAVQQLAPKSMSSFTYQTVVAGDVTGGMQYATSDGQEILIVKSAAASGLTIGVGSVPCSHGRAGDLSFVIGASVVGRALHGLALAEFQQSDGMIYLNLSGLSGTVEIAVLHP